MIAISLRVFALHVKQRTLTGPARPLAVVPEFVLLIAASVALPMMTGLVDYIEDALVASISEHVGGLEARFHVAFSPVLRRSFNLENYYRKYYVS